LAFSSSLPFLVYVVFSFFFSAFVSFLPLSVIFSMEVLGLDVLSEAVGVVVGDTSLD
jgi:hypothetical protein